MAKIRNPENAELICDRLADGYTLRQIAKELDCSPGSITDWVRADDQFAVRYTRAMELRADRMAEEIQEIADDGTNDWMEREGVAVGIDHEHIQRSKLRVDARKWLMAKMAPRKYGDSIAVTGANQGPIQLETVTPEQRAAQAVALVDEAFGPVIGVSKGTDTVQ